MKVFADGVFYGKEPHFSRTPQDVILSAGRPDAAAPEDLVRYPLSVSGVSCAIVGIGKIDRARPENDQLMVNLTAAMEDVATGGEMRAIEQRLAELHGTETNYFQEKHGLVQPTAVRARREGERFVIEWLTAFAGPDPIRSYNVYAGEKLLASVPFRPQMTLEPLKLELPAREATSEKVRVEAVV